MIIRLRISILALFFGCSAFGQKIDNVYFDSDQKRSTKGLFIILMFLLFTTSLSAQTTPKFNATDPRNNQKQSLQTFLGAFNRVPLDDCLKAMGTIKFKVNKKNNIDTIAVEGNLPAILVNTIKSRIKATEGHWSADISKGANYKRWFVIPVFVDRQSRKNCVANEAVSRDLKILTTYFKDRNDIVVSPTSYLLYPFDISSIY